MWRVDANIRMRTPVSNSYDSVKELSQHCSGFGSLGSDLIAHILAVGNVGVFTFVQMSRVCKAGYIACRDYEDAVMAVTLRMNRGMRQSLFCGLFCLTQEQAVDCFNWKYRCHVDGGVKVEQSWNSAVRYSIGHIVARVPPWRQGRSWNKQPKVTWRFKRLWSYVWAQWQFTF